MEAAQKTVDAAIAAGTAWTDPEFPPEAKSLFDPINDAKARKEKYDGIVWRRASEIYTEPVIFSDDVSVLQGGIGNCYLLSVLQAMGDRGHFDAI